MSEFQKMLKRLQSNPKNFTFREFESLMSKCGYYIGNKGQTSGSAIIVKGKVTNLYLHKPHKRNYLLDYQVDDTLDFLRKEGVL